jgi:hypothetical protein
MEFLTSRLQAQYGGVNKSQRQRVDNNTSQTMHYVLTSVMLRREGNTTEEQMKICLSKTSNAAKKRSQAALLRRRKVSGYPW